MTSVCWAVCAINSASFGSLALSVCSHPPITFLLVLQSVTAPLSVSVRWVSCVSVGPIEPLPGWSGVLHHVLACCCPSAISVGPLTRLASRMHATHARPPYSEDYRANIIISLQGVHANSSTLTPDRLQNALAVTEVGAYSFPSLISNQTTATRRDEI